jgi:flagellar hook-basal body complex protein FliE
MWYKSEELPRTTLIPARFLRSLVVQKAALTLFMLLNTMAIYDDELTALAGYTIAENKAFLEAYSKQFAEMTGITFTNVKEFSSNFFAGLKESSSNFISNTGESFGEIISYVVSDVNDTQHTANEWLRNIIDYAGSEQLVKTIKDICAKAEDGTISFRTALKNIGEVMEEKGRRIIDVARSVFSKITEAFS